MLFFKDITETVSLDSANSFAAHEHTGGIYYEKRGLKKSPCRLHTPQP